MSAGWRPLSVELRRDHSLHTLWGILRVLHKATWEQLPENDDPSRKTWLTRVFVRGLHPIEERRIAAPVFWRLCPPLKQASDPKTVHDKGTVVGESDTVDPCESFLSLADSMVDEGSVKLRGYGASEADAKKYQEAVRGKACAVDGQGFKISHVGEAVASEDRNLWESWCGVRVVSPMTVAATGREGSKLRNRLSQS